MQESNCTYNNNSDNNDKNIVYIYALGKKAALKPQSASADSFSFLKTSKASGVGRGKNDRLKLLLLCIFLEQFFVPVVVNTSSLLFNTESAPAHCFLLGFGGRKGEAAHCFDSCPLTAVWH